MTSATKQKRETDGGYYAIKGFLYQFDKTIIELLKAPGQNLLIESTEDIGGENYWIQVKHKETQDFSPSKVKKAVSQLINVSIQEKHKKNLRLYCFFKNREPHLWTLNESQLNEILGEEKDTHATALKAKFLKIFTIQFSENFELQFKLALAEIKKAFNTEDEDLAIYYHALLKSKLLEISIRKKKSDRFSSFMDLKNFVSKAEVKLSLAGYEKLLSATKYEALIKKSFFQFKTSNINNFQRLFIFESESQPSTTEVLNICMQIGKRYFVPKKSPAPYLCFRNLTPDVLAKVKRTLWDKDFHFNDGTHFKDDCFRWNSLLTDLRDKGSPQIKFIDAQYIDENVFTKTLDEIYQFYDSSPVKIETKSSIHNKIVVSDLKQISRICKWES